MEKISLSHFPPLYKTIHEKRMKKNRARGRGDGSSDGRSE